MFFPLPRPAANFSVTSVVRLKTATVKSLRFHVEDEVFAHHGEADEANITLIRVHFEYLLERGSRRSTVYRLVKAHGNFHLESFYHRKRRWNSPA